MSTRIFGLMLVRNDDRFVACALRNMLPLCDEVLVQLHDPQDHTAEEVRRVQQEAHACPIRVEAIAGPEHSHQAIEELAGTDTWIFAVDGDEIYDPAGLRRLREELLSGSYDAYWQLFGHVLHVQDWNPEQQEVDGFPCPPARPMTKLYNFSRLQSWTGCSERLHGGTPVYLDGVDPEQDRYLFYKHGPMQESPFRCLHLVFLKRSSLKLSGRHRPTPTETWQREQLGPWGRLKFRVYQEWRVLRGRSGKDNAYRQGRPEKWDTRPFQLEEARF